ncbi:hypothetical protein [Orientia tsutsugamushi]
MNHLFKQNAIQELVKYNKCLLSVTIVIYNRPLSKLVKVVQNYC